MLVVLRSLLISPKSHFSETSKAAGMTFRATNDGHVVGDDFNEKKPLFGVTCTTQPIITCTTGVSYLEIKRDKINSHKFKQYNNNILLPTLSHQEDKIINHTWRPANPQNVNP